MINLTYKYEVKGKRSRRLLRRYAWAVNQVWNYCVATQRKVQRTFRDGLTARWRSQFDLQKMTAGVNRISTEHDWWPTARSRDPRGAPTR